MQIPGQKRSLEPDECGLRAGKFAEAIRDSDMLVAWGMLSKESRGVRLGIWATQNNIDLQVVYRAAYDSRHPLFAAMMEGFRTAVLKHWPLEDLVDLGVAPTSYVDDTHAFVFLPIGVGRDQQVLEERTVKPGLVIPMLLEDSEWRVDMPGWRFFWK
jgi:hypothetical protein